MIHLKIRKLRKDLGLTQENMAEYLGISQNAYSLIEQGKTKIEINRLIRIKDKLQVGLKDLVTDPGNIPFAQEEEKIILSLLDIVHLKDKQIQKLLQMNLLLLTKLNKTVSPIRKL
jgi:transcriptional regulator with XRE-family HTH domain